MWLQAQQILQTGTLTKENTEYLSGMRDKMGLSKEQAEKIIKGVQNQRLIGGLEAAKNTGSLSLQKVLDMKESGVEIDSFISEEMRLNLYTKEVQLPNLPVYACCCSAPGAYTATTCDCPPPASHTLHVDASRSYGVGH